MRNPYPVDFAAIEKADGLPFGVRSSGEIAEFSPQNDSHLMVAGMTGSGKSVITRVLLYGAITKGSDVYIIDPVKNAWDFEFATPYARAIATNMSEAVTVLRLVLGESERRKQLNHDYGVASIHDLPDGVRPSPIVVLVDEFASLIAKPAPMIEDQPYEDADLENDRQQRIALTNSVNIIGAAISRLVRESRSTGVSLVLISQKFPASMLETIPGGGDIKIGMSRLLAGHSGLSDRMIGLRNYEAAPIVREDMPRGSAVFESFSEYGVIVHGWYASPEQLGEELAKRVTPLTDDQKLDLSPVTGGSATGQI